MPTPLNMPGRSSRLRPTLTLTNWTSRRSCDGSTNLSLTDEDVDEVEWWMDHEGPVGQAAQLIDMLGVGPLTTITKTAFALKIFPGFGAMVGEKGLERLKKAIAARGLPIEIIETR